MTGPTLDELLDRDSIPAPPLPFMVVETEGEIFIRHRDGKHYIPFRALGELECQYRVRCETICAFMNDAHDIGAREEHRRAKQIERASAEAFVGDKIWTEDDLAQMDDEETQAQTAE